MNAPTKKRNPFDALLRRRVEKIMIADVNGEDITFELREQPIGIVQPIIDRAGSIPQSEFVYTLMAASMFILTDEGLEPLTLDHIYKMTVETLGKLKPATDMMLKAYGLAPDAPAEEKKTTDDSQVSSAENSSSP